MLNISRPPHTLKSGVGLFSTWSRRKADCQRGLLHLPGNSRRCWRTLLALMAIAGSGEALGAQASSIDPMELITVAPANSTGQTITFRITNNSETRTRFGLTRDCTGIVVSCSGPSSVLLDGNGANVEITVTFSTGSADSGTIVLHSADASGIADGQWNVQRAVTKAAVTPDSTGFVMPDNTAQSYLFTVTNTGNTTATVNLTVPVCSAPASGCTLARTSVFLDEFGSDTVRVAFSAGAAGPVGQITVRGTVGSYQDDGSISIASYVEAPLQNPAPAGPGVERRLCLTIAAGSAGASECGDLRLVHPLPRLTTRTQTRGPVLLYNSHAAHPYVVITDTVGIPSNEAAPTNVKATLTFNGTTIGTRTWSGSDWASGSVRQIAVGFDATTPINYSNGLYAYSLLLQKVVNGSLVTIRTDTGHVIVVNRSGSSFRPGWWLAGVGELRSLPDGRKLFVGGDGTTRVYSPVPNRSGLWSAPQLDHPEYLQKVGAYYAQLLRDGVKVLFDTTTGTQRKTVNRLGDTTSFAWTDDACQRLTSITVPRGPAPTYQFNYGGAGCQQLTSVAQTTNGVTRSTTVAMEGDGFTLRITDPDNFYTRYYNSANNSLANVITKRYDRVGDSTSYEYDAAYKLSQVKPWVGEGATATPATFLIHNVVAKGINGASAVDTSLAFTGLDGPRTDVGDTIAIWLNRFGAPRRVLNALGDSASLTLSRSDPRWPALVTRLDSPHGRVQVATYDAHGNVTTATDSSSHRPGTFGTLYATSTYQWDLAWDRPTRITPPEGPYQFTEIAYDVGTGNPLWVQDGRGISTRTRFTYGASGAGKGLVSGVQLPNGALTNFLYDSLGNLASTQTPQGYFTHHARDMLGRDSLVRTQVDAAGSLFQRDSVVYNMADLPTMTLAYGPAYNGTPAQSQIASLAYDAEGRNTSVTRGSFPDTNHVGTLTTQTIYDELGRPVAHVSGDGKVDSVYYDAAGNDTLSVTRRGLRTRKHFDQLGRMVWRATDSVAYAPARFGLATLTQQRAPRDTIFPRYPNRPNGSYTVATDTATFTYNAVGQLLTANNNTARITRTYHTNGRDSTDTQSLRNWNDTTFGAHVFTLRYSYDLNGRRTKVKYPTTLVGVADSARWIYDVVSGNLTTSVDLLGRDHTFQFDSLNQLTRQGHTSEGIYEWYQYTLDGGLAVDSILNYSSSPNKYTNPVLRRTTLTYDARGKAQSVVNVEGVRGRQYLKYSGLGQLVQSVDTSRRYIVDPSPWNTTESFVVDALGNQRVVTRVTQTLPWPGRIENVTSGEDYYYANDATARLVARRNSGGRNDTLVYNSAGDIEREYSTITAGTRTAHDRASYYGADGLLRAADDRSAKAFNNIHSGESFYTFEEYRYDALGRRVQTRSRRYCDMNNRIQHRLPCLISFLRRTIWDGSMELAEIQMPAGGEGTTAPAVADSVMERDTGYAPLFPVDTPGTGGVNDPNPFFGRAAYTYGLRLDQPVSVNRYGYLENGFNTDSAHHFAPFSLTPLWNSRGMVEFGVFADGGAVGCDPTGSTNRCTNKILWLNAMTAYWRSMSDQTSWQGRC